MFMDVYTNGGRYLGTILAAGKFYNVPIKPKAGYLFYADGMHVVGKKHLLKRESVK
jgi:hypothetical protein